MTPRRSGTPSVVRWFFALCILPMFCVFPYLRQINNPNEFVRVFTSIAMVENHTFAIDEGVRIWGHLNDMALVPSKEDGQRHYYMVKTPATVYAGVVPYFVFSKVIAPLGGHKYPTIASSNDDKLWWLRNATWALRLGVVQLPCFLFLVWFERYLRGFSKDVVLRLAAVTACGLGTNYLAYTHMFASHAPYAAALFLAFAIPETALRRTRGYPERRTVSAAFWAGFFAGLNIALEYHSLFAVVSLGLFAAIVFRKPTRLAAYVAGGTIPGVATMYFHYRAYNNPLTPGHQLLETAQFAKEHKTGLWGVLWPSMDHLKALAFDPGFGLFGMSPAMILGVLVVPCVLFAPGRGMVPRGHARLCAFLITIVGLTLFLVNAGIIEWRAGWTVGPRYLASAPPFFAFGGLLALERISRSGSVARGTSRGVSGGLAFASVISMGTVSLMYDTLPETIARPFAQFAYPFARVGLVPHHVGEWFGWKTTTFWYVCCGAMLAASLLGAFVRAGEGPRAYLARFAFFALALAAGIAPAVSKPQDGSELFVLHPIMTGFPPIWEPAGRDRISLLRDEAERYGSRRPCMWYRIADLEKTLLMKGEAIRDEARAKHAPREQCPKLRF